MLAAARAARQSFRPQRKDQRRLGPACSHASGRQYRQAYGGQGWRAQLEALAGEGRESLARPGRRSEEHTSELQSQSNLVCRLLLEKKKKKNKRKKSNDHGAS